MARTAFLYRFPTHCRCLRGLGQNFLGLIRKRGEAEPHFTLAGRGQCRLPGPCPPLDSTDAPHSSLWDYSRMNHLHFVKYAAGSYSEGCTVRGAGRLRRAPLLWVETWIPQQPSEDVFGLKKDVLCWGSSSWRQLSWLGTQEGVHKQTICTVLSISEHFLWT